MSFGIPVGGFQHLRSDWRHESLSRYDWRSLCRHSQGDCFRPDGTEEVAYSFPGPGINVSPASDEAEWRHGGILKEKEMNRSKLAAVTSAKYESESSEPLWLQFDDDLVDLSPPQNVGAEMAYVLVYRRRRLTPASIAKHSTLE